MSTPSSRLWIRTLAHNRSHRAFSRSIWSRGIEKILFVVLGTQTVDAAIIDKARE